MLNTHLHDEDDIDDIIGLEEAIDELKRYIAYDPPGFAEVPLDLYTKLEDFGIDINKLINQLEKDIHGEGEVYYSYWGG